ncbi:hypothetical protein LMG28138_01845 [Pararobbsia alpina]|uniref:Uncharacterized protein n=1 Tax=Pararobbsia alpina TaxID=621374 RepID=A0A6S7BD00_9BURK|nr:hypothetical protein LMG28138_01845 [Pararobbsia alpina]
MTCPARAESLAACIRFAAAFAALVAGVFLLRLH